MSSQPEYTLTAIDSLRSIDRQEWDYCANPVLENPDCGIAYDPFTSYGFLHALEQSDSSIAATGWAPYHLKLETEGEVVGVMPMYLKNHSQGEYVFDYGWADAFERAGGQYYPKLQVSIPFTPATGRRLLTRRPLGGQSDHASWEVALLSGCMQVAQKMSVSSVHITFANESEWQRMGELGFLQRTHQQFHWLNNDYSDFDDFLAALSSKKRKNIKRERRLAVQNDVIIEVLTGKDIREEHWDAFYTFYIDTGSRKWGAPYLTRQFFSMVGESIPDDILLIMCRRGDRYIAGAINFIGSECLFGRNWGCIEHHEFLHFEVCYYQAIEFAIKHGLKRVEAGAQGAHKLARGYLATHTYSAHWIAHEGLRNAVDDFLESERQAVKMDIDYLEEHSPFRKS